MGCVFAASTLLWLRLDRAPPNWDDAWYLTNSLTVYDALTQGGIVGYLTKLNSVFGFKAPLIAALPAGFYLLLGRHWHAAYLVNIVAMWALFAALYRIATRWWNARAAVFAIAIAGTMPLLYGLARWYMVEYVLTALLAVAACVLIESDGLKRDRLVVLFGAICGFGLLLKISFPLFIFPLFAYIWLTSGRRGRPLLLTALPCLLLALPWYAGHFKVYGCVRARLGLRSACGNLRHRSHILPLHHHNVLVTRGGQRRLLVLLLSRSRTKSVCGSPPSGREEDGRAAAARLAAALRNFRLRREQGCTLHCALLPAAALVLAWLLDANLPRNRKGVAAAVRPSCVSDAANVRRIVRRTLQNCRTAVMPGASAAWRGRTTKS